MKGITLFSGIGGAAYGMQMAGIAIAASVELDLENQEYSRDCQGMSSVNFPGSFFYLTRVGDIADKLPQCDILQATPVCRKFSMLENMRSGGMGETLADTAQARDITIALGRCEPRCFWLEQVPRYRDTRSLDIIVKQLELMNFSLTLDCLDVADYGIPQNRKRLFLLASRGGEWRFPLPSKRIGWKEAIAGIPLEPAYFTKRQQAVLLSKLDNNYDLGKGILIQRSGLGTAIRRHNEPCWCLTRSSFTDGKGAARGATVNVLNENGFWNLPIRAIARLGGFPDSFQLGKHAGQGIGYAVPPRFAKQLIEAISNG